MTNEKFSLKQCIRDGMITQNPIFIQLLGLCSALAVSTAVTNAIGMGIAVTAVLMCSNVLISLFRKLIPNSVRIAAFIVIISGFVTIVELLIKAYFPGIYSSLGIYIPLITVNCIVLARAEAFASKSRVLPSLCDGLFMGLGYTAALILLSAFREIIGKGTFCGISIFGSGYDGVLMVCLPSGAFICLGIVVAAFQHCITKINDYKLHK